MRSVGNIPCTVTRKLELNMHWADTRSADSHPPRTRAHDRAPRNGGSRVHAPPQGMSSDISLGLEGQKAVFMEANLRGHLCRYPRALERRALVLSGLQVLPSLTKSAAT